MSRLINLFVVICTLFFIVDFVNAQSEVEQLHLAQGKDPLSMMAMWVTTNKSNSDCEYYETEDDGNNVMKVTGQSTNYVKTENNYKSPELHSALFTNLKPKTKYSYRCGDSSTSTFSAINTFKTMPAVGDKTTPLKFGVIGDLGVTKHSKKTVAHCLENDLDMMLHAGDLSYANCDQPIWDVYGRDVEILAKSLPWMVCAGNHEIEISPDKNPLNTFTAFEHRYKMPSIKEAEYGDITIPADWSCTPSQYQQEYNFGNSFYSFESGMAHVTVLNCYTTSNSDSEQYKFAETDLSSIDRTKTPWSIVMMHCPWYNSNTAHQQEKQTVAMKKDLEGIFHKYNVNIAFQGHVHAYERSYPVYDNQKSNKDGTIYITIGDGGNKEGHADTYLEPTPEWSAFRNGTHYGHGVFTVIDDENAKWEWNRNNDGVKVISDSVELKNIFKN